MPRVGNVRRRHACSENQSLKAVDAVESGSEAEIINARNGKPAARLVPVAEKISAKFQIGKFDAPPFSGSEAMVNFDAVGFKFLTITPEHAAAVDAD